MRNLIISVGLSLVATSAFAACPSLNGGWSGTSVSSEALVLRNADGANMMPLAVTNATFTLNVNGSNGTSNFYASATSNPGQSVQVSNSPISIGVSYDRAGCKGTLSIPGGETVYFTVSNKGKTVKGISYITSNGSFAGGETSEGSSKIWTLEKQ